MSTQLIFTPGGTGSASPITITTGLGAAIRLLSWDGLLPVAPQSYSIKGASQRGESLLDFVIPMRVVTAQALIQAADAASRMALEKEVSSAMAAEPVPYGGVLIPGRLTFKRDGFGDLEIAATPQSASMARLRAPGLATLDIEWLCPYPFWQDTVDSTLVLPLGTPAVAVNAGDVSAPILLTVTGACTAVYVTNQATGEEFEVDVTLADGDTLTVDTTTGHKSIIKVSGGVVTNEMGALNLANPRLWQLRPGNSSILVNADGSDSSTAASIVWRNRYSGG